jgi:hypothetical protein
MACAHSIEERQRILKIFRKISMENSIDCRILWRYAGRYWQDMFPELLVKKLMVMNHFIKRNLSLEN